jgi:hypothetical protein
MTKTGLNRQNINAGNRQAIMQNSVAAFSGDLAMRSAPFLRCRLADLEAEANSARTVHENTDEGPSTQARRSVQVINIFARLRSG